MKPMKQFLKKILPALSDKEINDFLSYERAKKLFLKYGRILEDKEENYNKVVGVINKINPEELKTKGEVILNQLNEKTNSLRELANALEKSPTKAGSKNTDSNCVVNPASYIPEFKTAYKVLEEKERGENATGD